MSKTGRSRLILGPMGHSGDVGLKLREEANPAIAPSRTLGQ